MRQFFSRLFGSKPKTIRRTQSQKKPSHRLNFDLLEDRQVPSTLQILGGVVTYEATAGIVNNLEVSVTGNTYTFKDTGEKINVIGISGATGSGTNTVTIPASQVQLSGMAINLGDKNDLVSISSTNNVVSIKAGDGNDIIDIGKLGAATLSQVQAQVSVDGELGIDSVRVNDPQAGIPRNYTITANQVSTTSGLSMNYTGAESLFVNAGAFPDTFNIQSTNATTRTTVNSNGGGSTFNVGNSANNLDDIRGLLTLNGSAPNAFQPDFLNIHDEGSTVSHSYTVRSNSVARSGSNTIQYNDMESLTLNAGSAVDSATVLSTSASTPVTLNLGNGNDGVNLGTVANSLDGIVNTVTVNGQAGNDTIVLNDQAANHVGFFVVTSDKVTRGFTDILNYGNAESLIVNAGNFNDFATVQSTLPGSSVTLKMGGGDDSVYIQNTAQSLDDILGTVTVDGQAGSDTLNINDQGEQVNHQFVVTSTTVTRDGAAAIKYANQETLNINAGSAPIIFFNPLDGEPLLNNLFFVKSTAANTVTNIDGARGEFIVGNDTNSLDGIQGALNLVDGRTLTLNDQGDKNANNYVITADTITRSGAAPITYQYFDSFLGLTLNAGAFNDNVDVQSASTHISLNMGAGNDLVTVGGSPNEGFSQIDYVSVNGEAGTDSVVLNDKRTVGILSKSDYRVGSYFVTQDSNQHRFDFYYQNAENLALNAGAGDDSFEIRHSASTTPIIIKGGAGNDSFRFGLPGQIVNPSNLLGAVTIDGQEGIDMLDYSAYTHGVRVNLATGTATGAVGGITNIENVTGSQANDILVGNDLDNVLVGRAGRDILIGRGGSDVLLGEAGDDILIGDSTVRDLNPSQLEDIMREWGRTDLTGTPQQQFDARVRHLIIPQLGGGLNGSTSLDGSTIISDGVIDFVDGGTELNWII